jgi:hypothetical protein
LNTKTIYIVVAVLIVVIVVGVAGYYYLYNPGNNETTPTPTPAPTVEGASNVQFSVNETSTDTGDLVGYNFICKDYNTANEVVRVDVCIGADTYSYILDAGQQTSWMSLDGGTTWMESTFGTDTGDWATYGSLFNDFVGRLVDQGNTNDLTYTTDTASITIYCVAVNQTIDESVFATS